MHIVRGGGYQPRFRLHLLERKRGTTKKKKKTANVEEKGQVTAREECIGSQTLLVS